MAEKFRFVADTNVLISRLLFRNSVPAQAVRVAMDDGKLILSRETLEELHVVLFRPKFDSYVTPSERKAFFHILRVTALIIESVVPLSASRDPNDDKFLALAVTGDARLVLSGDSDLLALHPFRGIDILNPRQYLDRESV